MKHTKRLLALLLSLASISALAMLAFAVEEQEPAPLTSVVNWDEFYIITQPEYHRSISSLKTFELSVEVNIPAGVVLEYQWYCESYYSNGFPIPGATDAVLRVKPGDAHHPMKLKDGIAEYYCVITGIEKNDNVVVSQQQLTSAGRVVTTHYFDLKRDIPFAFSTAFALAFKFPLEILDKGNVLSALVLWLLSPITYVAVLLFLTFLAFGVSFL